VAGSVAPWHAKRGETNGHSGADQNGLSAVYELIREELQQVEQLLTDELKSEFPFVDALVSHGFSLGGKRLRPALLMLSAKAVGPVTREHIVLAAVVEMIHTATLVHDDVLDEATLRRYRQTVNARWNNETSVLLGDYLFTHAFYLSSTLETTFACRTIGRSTNIVCEGELRQIDSRGRLRLTEDEYLGIIDGKTAELCSCCCLLGAHYAGGSTAVSAALARFGRDLGIAFQITDDLLDVLGTEAATGKTLGTDFNQQKMTLPLIRLLAVASSEEQATLERLLASPNEESRAYLSETLRRYDAVAYARQRAKFFANRAADELSIVEPSPASELLRQLTEFVVAREM
jgi:octaprenyl-diphosphate synthase